MPAERMKPGQSVHMVITKKRLIADIRELGPQAVLKHSEGMTVADAIGMLEADGREVFALGACDHHDELGYCQGHEAQDLEGSDAD